MVNVHTTEESRLGEEYRLLRPDLNERGRRRWAGAQVRRLGYGGQEIVHRATGLSRPTIRKGLLEIENLSHLGNEETCLEDSSRLRKVGGGRKRLLETSPGLEDAVETLLEPSTRGDPENPLRWTCKSTFKLCEELLRQGYQISQRSVCTLLKKMGYSLQANRKTREGSDHPDRDQQFLFINEKTKDFQKRNEPVISVDTKKKEMIGNYKNSGRAYHPKGAAPEVNVYDFINGATGKAAPYGVYDLSQNNGWVSVGISSDTAEFAVNSIRSWWREMGQATYKNATCLYINADGGGSNSARSRLWKTELQKFSNEINMEIHVSHFPPGTSKWNKIEHRMFSFISTNWRGQPLIDTATIVNLIGGTTTKKGLKIKAILDSRHYQKGIKISDYDMQNLNLHRHDFHGEWNYIIKPN